MTTRHADHTATKLGGSTVHLAVTSRLGSVSACNGRSMGMALTGPVSAPVTCGSCRKATATGRVTLAAG